MDHSMHGAHGHGDHMAGMRHDDHGDHGSHAGHSDHCDSHSHAMTFHSCVCAEILFNGWNTTNALELFGSCVVIFVAGILYEGLKYYRESLHAQATSINRESQVNIAKNECGTNAPCATNVVKYTMFSTGHLIQTCFHVVQATISYMLMLIFMTYNVWLCLALVLGLGVGYFLFGWKKISVVDPNEHCH